MNTALQSTKFGYAYENMLKSKVTTFYLLFQIIFQSNYFFNRCKHYHDKMNVAGLDRFLPERCSCIAKFDCCHMPNMLSVVVCLSSMARVYCI